MIRIIADSSCDLPQAPEKDFYIAPLTIQTENKQYVDDATLDVDAMLTDLAAYSGRTTTACPSIGAWLSCMEGADEILVITITSHLSGAYNAAVAAKELYLQNNPDAKISVIDSLSTGPEMHLLIEKIRQAEESGLSFEEIDCQVRSYMEKTRLFFSLQSLHNLAANGRVNKIVAAAVGVLGIRIVATASAQGEIEPISKSRGDKRAIAEMVQQLRQAGFNGGKVRISHVQDHALAMQYAEAIRHTFPGSDILLRPSTALCSFYAEKSGILIGIETE